MRRAVVIVLGVGLAAAGLGPAFADHEDMTRNFDVVDDGGYLGDDGYYYYDDPSLVRDVRDVLGPDDGPVVGTGGGLLGLVTGGGAGGLLGRLPLLGGLLGGLGGGGAGEAAPGSGLPVVGGLLGGGPAGDAGSDPGPAGGLPLVGGLLDGEGGGGLPLVGGLPVVGGLLGGGGGLVGRL